MIPGSQSDIVDTQTAQKKVLGKVLTNIKTFPAQEPVSQIRLSAYSVWMDTLPDSTQLVDYSTQLWNAFNNDITQNGSPKRYYEAVDPNYPIKQILVFCEPNAGTEYYSFDIKDNNLNRIDNLITTAFGNHFQPLLYMWDGSAIGKQISPISGVYWQVDTGGYLYTADKSDPDYSSSGYYLIIYQYVGVTLDVWNPPGSGGGGGSSTPTTPPLQYYREILSVAKTSLTLPTTPDSTTVRMFVNGQLQYYGIDFTVSGTTVTWTSTDFSLGEGDYIEITYYPDTSGSNTAPVINSSPVLYATENQTYSYQVIATDPDLNDTITYSLVTAPTFLSIDTNTGLITGTPLQADIGSYTVTVRVTDNNGAYTDQSYTLAVRAAVTGAYMVQDWDSLGSNGWLDDGSVNLTVVADATTPKPANCLQVKVPSGLADGSSPGKTYRSVEGLNDLYIGFYLWVDPNRYIHPIVQKLVYLFNASTDDNFYLGIDNNDNIIITCQPNWARHQILTGNMNPAKVVPGTWQWLEIHAQIGTPGNSTDTLELWVDGVQTHSYTNLSIIGSQAAQSWGEFRIDPIFGGPAGEVNGNDWYLKYDYVVFSTLPIGLP